jgi:hypothetical protein
MERHHDSNGLAPRKVAIANPTGAKNLKDCPLSQLMVFGFSILNKEEAVPSI